MVYKLKELQYTFYCPLCGSIIKELEIGGKYCEHFVGLFTEQTMDGDACLILNEDIRKEYFQELQSGFPRNMDDSSKLTYKSKKMRRLIKENNWFALSFKEFEPHSYEDPIIRIILRSVY